MRGTSVGSAVLEVVLAEQRPDARPVLLAVDHGSAARRFSERHGFERVGDSPDGVEDLTALRRDG